MPVDFRTTLATLPLAAEHCDHYVVHDPRVLHGPAVALPGRVNIVEEPADTPWPSVGIRVKDPLRHVHDEVVGAEVDESFGVTAVEKFVGAMNGLGVLLRHRLRSISREPAQLDITTNFLNGSVIVQTDFVPALK